DPALYQFGHDGGVFAVQPGCLMLDRNGLSINVAEFSKAFLEDFQPLWVGGLVRDIADDRDRLGATDNGVQDDKKGGAENLDGDVKQIFPKHDFLQRLERIRPMPHTEYAGVGSKAPQERNGRAKPGHFTDSARPINAQSCGSSLMML